MIIAILCIGIISHLNVTVAGYSDVPTSHNFYDEIMFLQNHGVIEKGTKFGVNDRVTREEVAVMVSKAVGLNGDPIKTKFNNVPASLKSLGYINSAVKKGLFLDIPMERLSQTNM